MLPWNLSIWNTVNFLFFFILKIALDSGIYRKKIMRVIKKILEKKKLE